MDPVQYKRSTIKSDTQKDPYAFSDSGEILAVFHTRSDFQTFSLCSC